MPIVFFLIAELLIFAGFADHFGFLKTLAAYILPSFLGFMIVLRQGTMTVASLQASLMRGQRPDSALLHAAARIFGGVLMITPFFMGRVLAVCLLLPGVRHILLFIFSKKMMGWAAQKAQQGGFKFYYSSRGPFDGASPYSRDSFQGPTRDAEIVDVTPVEVRHEELSDPQSQDPNSKK